VAWIKRPMKMSDVSLEFPVAVFTFSFKNPRILKQFFVRGQLHIIIWIYLPVYALQSAVLQVNLQLAPVDKLFRFTVVSQFVDFNQGGQDVSIAIVHVVYHIFQKQLQTCVQATAQPLNARRVAQRLHQQSYINQKY
jgi:hypothetical protein